MAASLAQFRYTLAVADSSGLALSRSPEIVSFAVTAALGNGQRQTISLAGSVYTAISVPAGAKFMAIILGQAVSLTLKGNTSDVGIPLVPATLPIGVDLLMPLGLNPTPGILNGIAGSQSVDVIFC